MRRPIIVLVVFGLIGIVAYRILIGGFPVMWHQRLTVVVQTPSGEVRGASVTEVSGRDDDGLLQLPQSDGVKTSVRGEAVVVEVAPGRYLFALLDGANAWATQAFDLDDQPDPLDRTNSAAMAKLRSLPLDTPGNPDMPLLVTFDDVTKPETVRRVDPDDLDVAFGCDHEAALSSYPWRVARLIYRDWAASEVLRLSREMATERAGLAGPVGDAITETYAMIDDHNYNAADKLRIAELQTRFTEQQRRTWRDARYALEQELPATLPTPQSVSAANGKQCHQLTSVTLEITRERVTKGRVEGVLGWLGPYPEPHLIPGDGRTTDIPFGMKISQGDFIHRSNL